ncbi:MAG: DUF4349 domain-containing protein [Patescibacteria group bacterium]
MTRTPSFLARIARLMLITGLVLVALILLATYASMPRPSSMMSWWDKTERNAVTSSSSGSVSASDSFGGGMMGYAIAPETAPAPSATTTTDVSTTTTVDQRVIKTGSIDMTSNDVPSTVSLVSNLATIRGGFVQTSSTSDDEQGKTSAYIVLRVPSGDFDATMTDIKGFGVHVNNESISGEDVTEQFTDVSARLAAAKAQEEQYLIILKSATTVGEVLAVQEHLAIVRADIESLQGQVNYLTNRTDLATISIVVSEEPTAETASDSKFDPARDANSAVALVITLGQHALSVLIWAAIIGTAVGIPVGLVAFIYWLITRRRDVSKRRK